MPAKMPAANPRNVFPSPKILRPSIHVLPRSMDVPPPNTTAKGLGRYAGSMIQNAERTTKITSSILITALSYNVIVKWQKD
jgi:hypothetical protein